MFLDEYVMELEGYGVVITMAWEGGGLVIIALSMMCALGVRWLSSIHRHPMSNATLACTHHCIPFSPFGGDTDVYWAPVPRSFSHHWMTNLGPRSSIWLLWPGFTLRAVAAELTKEVFAQHKQNFSRFNGWYALHTYQAPAFLNQVDIVIARTMYAMHDLTKKRRPHGLLWWIGSVA